MSSATYRPRFGYDIRINAQRPQLIPAASKRCAAPGCREPAEISVPKSRRNMEDGHWLCRVPLREHNAQWDFFAGMSHEAIERFCLDAITGHRPTWPLGKRTAGTRDEQAAPKRTAYSSYHFDDGFAVFEEAAEAAQSPPRSRLPNPPLNPLPAPYP